MQGGEKLSLEQIRALLEATIELRFAGHSQKEVYGWLEATLNEHGYRKQSREGKGVLRDYIGKMTGLSRAQMTRLIGKHAESGEVRETIYRRHRFASTYTRADIELLAAVDEAHETLNGAATKKILQREFGEYGKSEYQRLGCISVAQMYRLRQSRTYRSRRVNISKTKPTTIAIGERRRPEPEGRPGFIRVDTVHQGDKDGVKGVYHINAVDEVTQWEVVVCVARICEAFVKPAIAAMLAQFPFKIQGFHSDNGSEFINYTVGDLLKTLLIEQTKSRPRRTNDNGLIEAKNGAVIRKHMGYTYIAADNAPKIERFYESIFNGYLNFHRPCGQVKNVTDSKGRQRPTYPSYATPWEVFRKLPDAGRYLKPGVTLNALDCVAKAESDTEAARRMQDAKRKLFLEFQPARRTA
jgi:transposase InsO family protein